MRPLYPIIKAIEVHLYSESLWLINYQTILKNHPRLQEIKKEMGLMPNKKTLEESTIKTERPRKKCRACRRFICPKPVPVDQIF